MAAFAKGQPGTGTPGRQSLREIVQKTILDEVIGNPASVNRWKVFIMDEPTTKVVSAALTMFDIMEQNVSLVENLDLGRQTFPDMDAVYFISPTMSAAKKVMGDFISPSMASEMPNKNGKPVNPTCRYGSVHLIFTGTVPKSVMELFQSNPLLISKIQTFSEVPLEFLAVENYTFHLNMADSLRSLYGKESEADHPALLGRKLASLCITLNEFPNIRFQESSPFAQEAAKTLNRLLQAYKKANPEFTPHGDDSSSARGQILILDRTFDPLSPLMHEYTYQAMANDLLNIDARGMIKYSTTTEKGKIEKEAILNSESDILWREYRHKHIAKVIASLKERMDDILQTSAGAKIAKKRGGDVDISTMAAAVKNLPEYTQIMNDLGRHVAISQQCMNAFGKQNLINISSIEQTLSTGYDDDGKEVKGKKALEILLEVIDELPMHLQMRLLAVYFITQRPVVQSDRQQLITAAKLSGANQQILLNLEKVLLGPLDAAAKAAAASVASSTTTTKSGGGGFFSRLLGGHREAEKIEATAEGEYADTRHVGQLKVLTDQLISSQLSADKYPSLGPALPVSTDAKSTAQSVRKYKATDRWGGAQKNSTNLVGGRIIVFIAGGVSYGEMRDAYELMAKENREVIIGGTHIVTPTQYLEDINSLVPSKAKSI